MCLRDRQEKTGKSEEGDMERTDERRMAEAEKAGKVEGVIARVTQRKNIFMVTAPRENLKQCSKKAKSPSRSSTTP